MLNVRESLLAIIGILCISQIGLSVSEDETATILTDLVDSVMQGTVYIQSYDTENRQISSGSGFFINDEGDVVTCNHVVDDEIEDCNLTGKFFFARVTTSDSNQYIARAIRYDPKGDLALLDVEIPESQVQSLSISTSRPKVGEDIIVIGAPDNNRFSVTKGIISSTTRKDRSMPAYQIDATTSPGSSGGPVFNMDGEVIGVVRSSDGPGLNFVVPAERIDDLISQSSVTAPARDWDITFDDVSIQNPPAIPMETVHETEEGDLIIAAFMEDTNKTVLAKLDSEGEREWFREFSECEITSIQGTEDGGYVLAGGIVDSSSRNAAACLIKTDSDGRETWRRTLGTAYYEVRPFSLQAAEDGGYLLAGYFRESKDRDPDGLLIKTDSTGELLWSKTFEQPNFDSFLSAEGTEDGGFALLRLFENEGWDLPRSSLMKVDSQGEVLWNRTYDSFLDEEERGRCAIFSARQTDDGGFILAGFMRFGSASESGLLIKADEDGCPVWTRIFGLGFDDSEPSIAESSGFLSARETDDGGYILCGFKEIHRRGYDGWVMKTDASGNENWNRTLGGSEWDTLSYAKETIDGGYILAGSTNSYRNTLIDDDRVMWMIKLDGTE